MLQRAGSFFFVSISAGHGGIVYTAPNALHACAAARRDDMRGESKKRSVASMRALAAAAIATVYVVWQTMPAVSAAPTPAANSAAGAEAAVGAAAGVRSPVRNFESPEPTLRSAALSTGTAASASKATGTNRHTYECRGTECSICHFDVAEVAGRHQPFSDGSIAQDRVNGTVISAQQLEDEGIRYLQARDE
eukprot:1100810-Pleurochrysis_carterae.AAC.3